MLGDITGITLVAGVEPMSVGGNTVYYSKAFRLKQGWYFGLWYKATVTSGAPDLKIELEESYKEPTTEGASDSTYVLPTGVSAIETSLTSENPVVKALQPVPMTWGRLRISGAAGNSANCKLLFKLFVQDTIM